MANLARGRLLLVLCLSLAVQACATGPSRPEALAAAQVALDAEDVCAMIPENPFSEAVEPFLHAGLLEADDGTTPGSRRGELMFTELGLQNRGSCSDKHRNDYPIHEESGFKIGRRVARAILGSIDANYDARSCSKSYRVTVRYELEISASWFRWDRFETNLSTLGRHEANQNEGVTTFALLQVGDKFVPRPYVNAHAAFTSGPTCVRL